jgi:hypothetical protein
MTTDRQIGANRRNAAHSTGPRTPEGRAGSSGNSERHGFRAKHSIERALSAEAERIASLLAAGDTSPPQLAHARIAAEAQMAVWSIRAARLTLLDAPASDPTNSVLDWLILKYGPPSQPQPTGAAAGGAEADRIALAYLRRLRELALLDRYERNALARRRRALCALNRHSS